jgi:hypothetical protein
LLKLIEKNNYFLPNFENIVQDEEMLSSFDIDNIELETLMWQTGYLTIDKIENIYDNLEYHLVIPNREVRPDIPHPMISKIIFTKSLNIGVL